MNIIDILVGLVLVWCLWSGWRSGILVQLSGIVGIVLGAWVAFRFSQAVGEWLDMEEMPAEVLFVIVLLGVLVCVIVLCRLITHLLKAGGLALPLRVLGAAFAVVKGVFILGLALMALEGVRPWLSSKNKASLNKSLTEAQSYAFVKQVGAFVFPYIAESTKAITRKILDNTEDYPTIDPVGTADSSSTTGATTDNLPVGDSAIRIMP